MPEPTAEELLRIARPMVKGHIRQTRALLEVLCKLDEVLNQPPLIAQPGGTANGKTEKHLVTV